MVYGEWEGGGNSGDGRENLKKIYKISQIPSQNYSQVFKLACGSQIDMASVM